MSTNIKVVLTQGHGPMGQQAILTMPRARAEVLFHDLNRVLSLIDDEVAQGARLDPSDREAYSRLSVLVADMQEELQPEQEGA